jgi:hypothetical protein
MTAILLANGLTLFFVLQGQLGILDLLVLLVLETLGLLLIHRIEHRVRSPFPQWRRPRMLLLCLALESVVLLAMGLLIAALMFLQLLTVGLYGVEPRFLTIVERPELYLVASPIKWPLLITLGSAVAEAVLRKSGQSDRGLPLVSRLMTLLLGAFMIVGPMMLMTLAARQLAPRMRSAPGSRPVRATSMPSLPILGIAALTALALFEPLRLLGVVGWLICFLSTKAASEILLAKDVRATAGA